LLVVSKPISRTEPTLVIRPIGHKSNKNHKSAVSAWKLLGTNKKGNKMKMSKPLQEEEDNKNTIKNCFLLLALSILAIVAFVIGFSIRPDVTEQKTNLCNEAKANANKEEIYKNCETELIYYPNQEYYAIEVK
jgi:hypothetical protein